MLTTCAVATFAGLTAAACGGGAPAPDTSAGTSPTAGDSVTTAPASMTEGGASQPAAEAGAEGRATPPSTPPSAGTSREPRAPSLKPDTVRGIVTEVGSYPMTSVVVQPASGGALTITGALAREIARAAGAEVWVSGRRDARNIEAREYAVRTVDGEAATDGVIARDGDRLVLVTPSGRRPIARPLQALGGMIGARVWLVGPLDGTITSYGILREP